MEQSKVEQQPMFKAVLLNEFSEEMAEENLFDANNLPKHKPHRLVNVPIDVYNKVVAENGKYLHDAKRVSDSMSEGKVKEGKVKTVGESKPTDITFEIFQAMKCPDKLANIHRIFSIDLLNKIIADENTQACVLKSAKARFKSKRIKLI
jgi:hypothetical protein